MYKAAVVGIVLFFTGTQTLFGQQVPGYLGMRFSVGYDAYVFPSFVNPNNPKAEKKNVANFSQKGMSLNSEHHLTGQWSFSKKASLTGGIAIANTNYIPVEHSDNEFSFDEYPDMRALSYEIGLRVFSQHYSPLGKFAEFRIGFTQVKTEDFNYSVQKNSGSIIRPPVNYTVSGTSTVWPTIALCLGTTRIQDDLFVFTYGVDFKLYPGGAGHYSTWAGQTDSNFRNSGEGDTFANQYDLIRTASARYAMQCAVNLRFGVGILL